MTNKTVDRFLLALILALLLLSALPLFAQDSPAALDARWATAGPTAAPLWMNQIAPRGVAPYPGMWHCATAGNFRYCPCYPPPYQTWVDPETLNTGLFRYDFSPMRQPQGCPGLGGTPPCLYAVNGGPNHSLTWLDPGAVERPIKNQPAVPNFYPGPAGLCDVWLVNGNTGVCPNTNYVSAIQHNAVWTTAYNYKKPAMDADPGCQGGAVTPTRTKTPTPVPSPTRTPTPAPNQFGRYITWATEKGIMSGCGSGNFCPGTPVNGLLTRAQYCATTFNAYKLDHQDEPLSACKPLYLDVICGAP